MYYIANGNYNSLNVFVDQLSLVQDSMIGFMSAIGSRRALPPAGQCFRIYGDTVHGLRHRPVGHQYLQRI